MFLINKIIFLVNTAVKRKMAENNVIKAHLVAGTLELVVTTAKTSVRAEVQARSRGLYDVTFVPQDLSPHFVNITFNDQVHSETFFEIIRKSNEILRNKMHEK
jgi:hypothetical protein